MFDDDCWWIIVFISWWYIVCCVSGTPPATTQMPIIRIIDKPNPIKHEIIDTKCPFLLFQRNKDISLIGLTWPQHHHHVIKSPDHGIEHNWEICDVKTALTRMSGLTWICYIPGDTPPHKRPSDAWIPVKYLHHYSIFARKLWTVFLL